MTLPQVPALQANIVVLEQELEVTEPRRCMMLWTILNVDVTTTHL